MEWEVRFLLWVQEHLRSHGGNRFWFAVTFLGFGAWFSFLCCILLIAATPYQRAGKTALIAVAFMELVVNIISKRIVGRARPFTAHPEIQVVGWVPRDKSFPSGHTASAFACALLFLRMLPLWMGLPAVAVACLIAFSRLYLGAHYPTDLLGGIAAALIVDGVLLAMNI